MRVETLVVAVVDAVASALEMLVDTDRNGKEDHRYTADENHEDADTHHEGIVEETVVPHGEHIAHVVDGGEVAGAHTVHDAVCKDLRAAQ